MRFLNKLSEPIDLSVTPSQSLSLKTRLEVLTRIKQPGVALYLFSDFKGLDDECQSLLLSLSQHQDILITVIMDEFELNLPKKGIYTFSNGVQQVSIDTAKSQAVKNYYQLLEERISRISRSGLVNIVNE